MKDVEYPIYRWSALEEDARNVVAVALRPGAVRNSQSKYSPLTESHWLAIAT